MPRLTYLLVLSRLGVRIDLDNLIRQVDYPVFGYAGLSVERPLHFAVILQSSVGYFNYHDYIGGRYGPLFAILLRLQQGEVGFGLRIVGELNRALHPGPGGFPNLYGEHYYQV